MRTLYDVLGVRPDDDREKIKLAFRKLAKAYHPDVNFGNQRAEQKFKKISAAHQILKDPERRAAYDAALEVERQLSRQRTRTTVIGCTISAAASASIVSVAMLYFQAPPASVPTEALRPRPLEIREFIRTAPEPIVSPSPRIVGAARLDYQVPGRASPIEIRAAGDWTDQQPLARDRSLAGIPAPGDRPDDTMDAGPPRVVAADDPLHEQIQGAQPWATPPLLQAQEAEQRKSGSDPASRKIEAAGHDKKLAMAIAGAATPKHMGEIRAWSTYRNERFDFSLRYPAHVFAVQRDRPDVERLTGDGRARLLVSSALNKQMQSLATYRRSIVNERYGEASFDYAPVRKDWFVLSGTLGEKMFYERVSFTCAGRVILNWQLTYPVAERQFYDRIVEEIHRTYRYRKDKSQSCD